MTFLVRPPELFLEADVAVHAVQVCGYEGSAVHNLCSFLCAQEEPLPGRFGSVFG